MIIIKENITAIVNTANIVMLSNILKDILEYTPLLFVFLDCMKKTINWHKNIIAGDRATQ